MACFNLKDPSDSSTLAFEKVEESQLDLVLLDLFDKDAFKGPIDRIFDISPLEIAKNKVESIKKITSSIKLRLTENGEYEKLHDHPDYIGITEFVTDPISGQLVNPFDDKAFKDSQIAKLEKTMSRSEAESIVDQMEKSWKISSLYGEEIHSIMQAVLENRATLPKTKYLSDEWIKFAKNWATNFKNELYEKHGKTSEFYCELSIAAKEISPDLKTKLESVGKKNLSGTIDLLVIDENGKAHIYDFKTSKHSIGSSWTSNDGWHPNKKRSIEHQLAGYVALLQQYDLNVVSTQVVPMTLDFIYNDTYNSEIVGLNNIKAEEIVDVPNTMLGKNFTIWKTFLPAQFNFNTKTLIETDAKIRHMLPVSVIRSIKVQMDTKDVQYYIEQCKPVNPGSEYYGKKKWSFLMKGLGDDKIVYFDNDQDRNEKIEKYVSDLKNVRANELDSLAANIQEAIAGNINITDIANSFSEQKQVFIAHQFQKYIDGNWQFIRNPEMNAYGIFIFQKDGRTEVVGISNQALGTSFKLLNGKSILGKTRDDINIDSKKILDATTGNMELMRLMTYIADNQDIFKNMKITQVRVINPWHGSQVTANNQKLIDNYNLLVQDNAGTFNGELKFINPAIFWGDVTSMLSIANDLLKLESETGLRGFSLDGLYNHDGKLTAYTTENINKFLHDLRRQYGYLYGEDSSIGDPNIWAAYKYLNDALLSLTNKNVVQEFGAGFWFDNGIIPGTAVASTSYSPSANIRIFDDVMAQYSLEIRTKSEKLWHPLANALKAYYKEKGHVGILGGEANYFTEWFVKDVNGKIDSRFILKDPNDENFGPASKKALDLFLKTMAKLRWPSATEEEIEIKKAEGTYYQVPLTEARFIRQAKSLGTFGTIKALNNKLKQYKELTQDVFAGESERKEQWNNETFNKNLARGLFNKFFLTEQQRIDKIKEKGVGFFETDLEEVIRQALTAYVKSDVSRKYIPIMNALQTSLRISQSFGEQKQKDVIKALDLLIKSKFYGEDITPDDLKPLARWLSVLKKITSTLSLGFNLRSFVREFFQGTWMGISRAGLNNLPGVSEKTYVSAFEHVLTEAHKNFSSVSKLQQLDARFGVANYSLNNMSRKRRINWFGIRNLSSDTLFWGSTAPDFQHRMTMLVAKMMGDGVWEAYTTDSEGTLTYNWKRDKRFSIYASGNTDHKDYLLQKTLYERHIEELNNIGFKCQEADGTEREYRIGDDLPEAYLPKEIQAIKNYSDLLYGHYDDESRSLINDMFLGALFMQYKTYIVSRVEHWTLAPGTYNTEFLQWDEDPITGKKLYKIHSKELVDGRPNIEIKAEDQIKNMEQLKQENLIEPLLVWKGMPMEGIGRSYIGFFNNIKSWDWQTVKEKWSNPIERDNILLGIHDCVFASLMTMILTGLFGMMLNGEWTTDSNKVARAARDAGWGASFAYNVSVGSFQDFPIWSSLKAIGGDWNPPLWTSAKRIVENSGAVIMGNKSIFQAITNTVGAAADLKGLANRLAEA